MMHEFIESRKKAFRNNSTKNLNKTFCDNSGEIQAESSSITFLPPWLKNNLGLTQRINSSLDWSVCLPNFTNLETSSLLNKNEERTIHSKEESETESICTKIETKQEDNKMTNMDQTVFPEVEKLKDEEKKILKLLKQKNKIKRRLINGNNIGESGKCEVDQLLEVKAKEVMENLTKKGTNISDEKECEAKLLFFSNKCRDDENLKFSQQEIRLIQKLKEQADKSDIEKFMEQIKESSIKRFSRMPDSFDKSKEKNGEENTQKTNGDDNKINEDKDSLISTDDENDIKRFSEFLSKNKNQDEKRKCLEEVRNYFERKRRTRLTKRRPGDDSKTPNPNAFQLNRKEEQLKEKPKTKEVFTLLSGRDRKNKLGFYDEEIVEKAVNETLQKFVNLYHFRVSPTVMSSMRRNILKAIQSDSLDSDSSKPNLTLNKSLEETKLEKDFSIKENETEADLERKGHQMCAFNDNDCKELKKKTFKTFVEAPVSKPPRESDVVENENVKRLKKEFENFLNSIQAHADVTGLKLQSVILEKEQSSSSKTVQFVYNFTKKAIESNKVDGLPVNQDAQEAKSRKDSETQTVLNSFVCKKNVKSQTFGFESFEKCLQTEEKIYTNQDVQTESLDLMIKELKEVTSSDVSPGLYRMVKSKEVGKFYLYPENLSKSSEQLYEHSSSIKEIDTERRSRNKTELVKFLIKENTLKDRRTLSRDGKFSKRAYVLAARQLQKRSATDHREAEKLKSSLSCLYFKNHPPCESVLKSTTHIQNKTLIQNGTSGENVEEKPKENHLGCVWFWNGEKITPGCDLKMHVENLLKEKLKELTNSGNYKLSNKEPNKSWLEQTSNSERNLDIRNTNAVFCFKKPLGSENDSSVLMSADYDSLQHEAGQVKIMTKGKINEEKSVRDACTQNSQQTFLSLNVANLKGRTKSSSSSRICRAKSKRRKLILKPIYGPQRYSFRQKKIGNSKEALENLKIFQSLNEICMDSQENTSYSCSTIEVSTSSSASAGLCENPMTFIQEPKKLREDKNNIEEKQKGEKMISTVNHEVQTKYGDENSVESQTQDSAIQNCRQWELIENVLNRTSQKKRESLWNDVREFVRMKLGKDINDDEAQEVCIEIEQDVSEMAQGKLSQAVMAKGHYKKSEGDVEVEIDLTLEDLEKILRSRKKKTQGRRLLQSSKGQKVLSSSFT